MTLTRQEARLVRELSYTPGRVVRWPILVRGAWGRGVYLPVDWERR